MNSPSYLMASNCVSATTVSPCWISLAGAISTALSSIATDSSGEHKLSLPPATAGRIGSLSSLTIADGKTPVPTAMELGSNFVLAKPLDLARLSTYFQSSVRQMEAEHRRYFRYELTPDAEVIRRDGTTSCAQILNVSDGCLALRLLDRAHLHGSVTLRFSIPDAKRTVITAIALICWSRGPVVGIRFFGMHEDSGRAYAEWFLSMTLV